MVRFREAQGRKELRKISMIEGALSTQRDG
jgi:hypothetical protein